jgi:hypothetical protein
MSAAESAEAVTPGPESPQARPDALPTSGPRGVTLPRWVLAGIAAGLAISIVWPVVFGVLITPRLDHDPKVVFPSDPDPYYPLNNTAPPYNVAISPSAVLTGTASGVWNVSFCAAGSGHSGSGWLCAFSMRDVEPGYFPPCRTVDAIQVSGAGTGSLTPSLPQTVCQGGTVGFALTINVPTTSGPTLSPIVVIDSK